MHEYTIPNQNAIGIVRKQGEAAGCHSLPFSILASPAWWSPPQASLATPHEAVHGTCTLSVQGVPCLRWEGLQPCGLLGECEALADTAPQLHSTRNLGTATIRP